MFRNEMETQAIPERVYALCKLVEKTPASSKEISEKMEPEYLKKDSATTYFSKYKSTAIELGLISEADNQLSLSVDHSALEDMNSFRKYVNNKISEYSDGLFYRVTKLYFERGIDIVKETTNVSELYNSFALELGTHMVIDNMRAWRFWVSFLGFGYLMDDNRSLFLPNAADFIWDLIESANFDKNVWIPMSSFIEKIEPNSNIIIDSLSKNFNYGVSNGFRTLKNLGKIDLFKESDAPDIWNLYSFQDGQDVVTQIKILK